MLNEDLVSYCCKHNIEHEKGFDWCDCNDFGNFVNMKYDGKWHTLYCMNDGSYKFDTTIVANLNDILKLLGLVRKKKDTNGL